MKETRNIYRGLQRHFDSMPVGFPRTRSGVELDILRHLFSPDEAQLAIYLDFSFRTSQEIAALLPGSSESAESIRERLETMSKKGSILRKRRSDGTAEYAAAPFILGMIELQSGLITPDLTKYAMKYLGEGFGLEYISSEIPQSRVIPIEKSIDSEHIVAQYDDIRKLVESAPEPIVIGECICRQMAHHQGHSCATTHRMEVCMGFGDFADQVNETGWGRTVSREEALETVRQNEEDGLVLQPSNEQNPLFVCACCSDCCGLLAMAKSMPRPVDFVASNYTVATDSETCTSCMKCIDRCPMDAVSMIEKVAVTDPVRCIGCGVCVPTCNVGARSMVMKDTETVPPENLEDLYSILEKHKKNQVQKLYKGIKAKMGLKT